METGEAALRGAVLQTRERNGRMSALRRDRPHRL